MGLPDFLVIGAPKAGSTAIHAALVQHPQLFGTVPKEPKFFLTDGRAPRRQEQRGPGDWHSAQEWVWQRARYEQLFDAAPPGTLKGESTPFYLWDRAAHLRIKAAVPDVKLIAAIRDPVDRAYSNWTHLWADGLETEPDFLRACLREPERIAQGYAPFWRYLELSRYGEQLEHLFSVFDRSQVFVLRYRDLVDAPAATLDAITGFLGVEQGVISTVPSSNVSSWAGNSAVDRSLRRGIRAGAALGAHVPPKVWRQAQRPLVAALHRGGVHRPPLDVAVRRQLVSHFADDVALLSRLLDRNYDDWLSDAGRGTFAVRRS
ncbi:sulfotransferase [Jatrophihabitans sp.]|uniref:sulfotransferase family protein n=1 Tax=Jatrophihabitans sp. TaxID=1932789 RepID=UPI0030C6D717|nr:sulfotransferase [Jatrophihabitans sp.]